MIATKNKHVNKNGGGHYKTIHYYSCRQHRKSSGRECSFNRQLNQSKIDSSVFEIFIRNNECRNGVLRDDEEERIRNAAEDAEFAGYYQQVQDALEGTSAGNSAEGIEDFTAGEVAPGERRSIREALATKGRTKAASGAEDRKREEQLPVPEQQAKRNRRKTR